jgi:hypothetical protein
MRPMLFATPVSASNRVVRWLAVICLSAMLAACGGSSNSNSGSNNSSSGSNPPTSSGASQPIAATAANTVPIAVGQGAANFINIPTVSVTVCAPGTSTCQTIDNVQVDTGSFGLRLASAAATQILGSLPVSRSSTNGQLAECTQFADGFTWGTVRTADVKIGGEAASSVPVQVIGDLNASTVPASCNSGIDESSASDLGANGILGVGTAASDCGTRCLSPAASNYFSCPSSGACTPVAMTVAQQVTNPATKFATDNNGVIVQLPPVTGAVPSIAGTLVFGIGTQSNNALTGVTSFASTGSGDLNGNFQGTALNTIFDTGSNGMFFNSNLTPCTGTFTDFYCPATTQSLVTTVSGVDGKTNGTVNFMVGNAQSLGSSQTNFVLNGLAGVRTCSSSACRSSSAGTCTSGSIRRQRRRSSRFDESWLGWRIRRPV